MSDKAAFVPSLIGSSGETLREAFGKALTAAAEKYPALVVLDADVAGGTGTHHFRRAYPDRFIQFGIEDRNSSLRRTPLTSRAIVRRVARSCGARSDIDTTSSPR